MTHTGITAMKTKSVPLVRSRRLFKAGVIILLINLNTAQVQEREISQVHRRTIDCGQERYSKSDPRILLPDETRWIQEILRQFDGSPDPIRELWNQLVRQPNPGSICLSQYLYIFGEPSRETLALSTKFLKTISTPVSYTHLTLPTNREV